MIVFILQSMLLLLLCFIFGLLLGRFIKRRLGNRVVLGNDESHVIDVTAEKPEQTALAVGNGRNAVFSAGIIPSNLQIFEGIGPAMEAVLKENGIITWSQLAAKTVPELRGILDRYGKRYQIIDPTTWLEQAKLAAGGKVDELIKLQKMDGESKLENMMNRGRKSGFVAYRQDDQKIVEGIGPKFEVLLNNAGIDTGKNLQEPSSQR